MSLKVFHICFILVSTVFLLGLGVWGLLDYMDTSDVSGLVLTGVSIGGGVLLMFYAPWFMRKYPRLDS